MTSSNCVKWKLNPNTNPETGKATTPEEFKKLFKKCKSSELTTEDCKFFDITKINPLTGRKISSEKTIGKINQDCQKLVSKPQIPVIPRKKSEPKKVPEPEIPVMPRKKPVQQEEEKGCKAILKTGKRKNERCGLPVKKDGFCGRHSLNIKTYQKPIITQEKLKDVRKKFSSLQRILIDNIDGCLYCKGGLFTNQKFFKAGASISLKFTANIKECGLKGMNVFAKIFLFDDYWVDSNVLEKINDYEIENYLNNIFCHLELVNMVHINELIKNSNSPHLIGLIDYINCDYDEKFLADNFNINIVNEIKKLYNGVKKHSKNLKVYILLMENIQPIKNAVLSIRSFLSNAFYNHKIFDEEYGISKVIFQYIYTLNVFRKNNFQHNDNHLDNYMIEEFDIDNKNKNKVYIDGKNTFLCNTKFFGKFIDYDRSISYDLLQKSNLYKTEIDYFKDTYSNVYGHSRLDIYYYIDYFKFFTELKNVLDRLDPKNMSATKLKEYKEIKNFVNEILIYTDKVPQYQERNIKYAIPLITSTSLKYYQYFITNIEKNVIKYEHSFFDKFKSKPIKCKNDNYLVFSNNQKYENIDPTCKKDTYFTR